MMSVNAFRRPLFAITAAVAIVVLAAAIVAPKITFQPVAPNGVTVEHVMVTSGASPVEPKLAVNIPRVNNTTAESHAVALARIGTVTMYVGDVNRAVDRVSAIARGAGGDVLSMQVGSTGSAPSQPDADVNVRMPATRFDDVMSALASVGTISRRSVTAQDVSSDITDSSARLRNLRRTETDILRIMNRSGNVDQVMSAESQLSTVREQIETLEAQLNDLHTRVVYATIDVTIVAESSVPQAQPSAGAQISTAFASAVHAAAQTAVGIVTGIVWLAAFLPYAAVLAACVYLMLRRRRTRST